MHPFPRTEEDDGGPPDGGSGADQRLSWSAHGLRDTTGRTGTYRYMAPEVPGLGWQHAACAAASARDGCAAALAWQGSSPSRLGWASDSDGPAPCAPRRRGSRCLRASTSASEAIKPSRPADSRPARTPPTRESEVGLHWSRTPGGGHVSKHGQVSAESVTPNTGASEVGGDRLSRILGRLGAVCPGRGLPTRDPGPHVGTARARMRSRGGFGACTAQSSYQDPRSFGRVVPFGSEFDS